MEHHADESDQIARDIVRSRRRPTAALSQIGGQLPQSPGAHDENHQHHPQQNAEADYPLVHPHFQILVFRIPAGNFRFFSHYFLFFLSFLRLAAETVGADHHFQLKMEPELV